MMRVLATMLVLVLVAGMGDAVAGDGGGKKPVVFKVLPIESFGVAVKNWNDESLPHYSIMTNPGEWKSAFVPVAANDKRPFQPNPNLYKKAFFVAISRVSDTPAPGEKVLVVKSLNLVSGELELAYSFLPPAKPNGRKVINSVLVAVPTEYQHYEFRFVEEIETPTSRATRAGVEAARAAGRIKPPSPKN